MRSRDARGLFAALLRKEVAELLASRAYWILLAIVGPLVGQAFLTAVALYAEASGGGGGAAALAQGLSPLDGILVPTLGAYDLAATLLFPFVAIRLISADKQSGALKLVTQTPASLAKLLLAKGTAILLGWLAAWGAGLLALLLWLSYGGHLHAPETLNLLFGHLLRILLSCGVAAAAAALTESAASAAIVTLGFTVGTWALDFLGAGHGGLVERLGKLTPTALLRFFEHGELRLSATLAALVLAGTGAAMAWVWLPPGVPARTKALRVVTLLAVSAAAVAGASRLRGSWDLSEDRRNSFPRADEAALRKIALPLHVTVQLAAEDPRLADLKRSVLDKLERVLPMLEVTYAATSRTGLFEGASYGEVWYELGGTKAMTRSTTVPIVFEQIYALAGAKPPDSSEEPSYPGHPLAAQPRGAAILLVFAWPAAVGLAFLFNRTRWR